MVSPRLLKSRPFGFPWLCLAATLVILLFTTANAARAATCSGQAVNSCGASGFTAEQCPNYYMNSGTQCKWSGSSCTNGGASCTPPSPSSCYGSAASSCSGGNYTESQCSLHYLDAKGQGTQCGWNGSYCSNSGASCTTSKPAKPLPRIFVATNGGQGWSGELNGVAGADKLCNSSSERPDAGKTYKALISYQSSNSSESRYACAKAGSCGGGNAKNWPLKANTTYVNAYGQTLGKTTSQAIFTFPLQNPIYVSQAAASNSWIRNIWTGTLPDWTADVDACQGWTSYLDSAWGTNGYGNATDSLSIGQASVVFGLDCHLPLALYCVEQ